MYVFVETSVHMCDGSLDKESTCNVRYTGDVGSILRSGRSPGGGHGNPLQYSCLENPHGQRSLVGYNPKGHKESDTTGQVGEHTHRCMCVCVCVCSCYAYIHILALAIVRGLVV